MLAYLPRPVLDRAEIAWPLTNLDASTSCSSLFKLPQPSAMEGGLISASAGLAPFRADLVAILPPQRGVKCDAWLPLPWPYPAGPTALPAGSPTGSCVSSRPAWPSVDRSVCTTTVAPPDMVRARNTVTGQAATSGRCCSLNSIVVCPEAFRNV